MAHPITIHNSVLELVLEVQLDIQADANLVQQLYKVLHDFTDTAKRISSLSVTTAAVNGQEVVYDYKAERDDGTELVGTLTFASAEDVDPVMTATIPGWPMSTIDANDVVLRKLIQLRERHGLVCLEVVFP